MSFLKRLLGSKNISCEWILDPAVPLEVDLDTCRLCGVGLGAPIEQFQHLGPSANTRWQDSEKVLIYPEQGFQVFLDGQGHVDGVDINLVPEADMAAFTGTWSFHNRAVTILPSHTPSGIEALLGGADRRAEKYPHWLCYSRGRHELWFEWDKNEQGQNLLQNVMLTL